MELGNDKRSDANPDDLKLADYLTTDSFKDHLDAILPKHMATDRFASVCLRQLSLIPDLQNCTLASVVGGMMTAATLGLEIGTQGECWLLPFWRTLKDGDRKPAGRVQEAQLQIGVWGHMALAWRSEHVRDVQIDVVLPGDAFSFRKGSDPYLHHEPKPGRDLNSPDDIQRVYAVVRTTQGGVIFDAFDHAWIERIRSKSQSPHSPAWQHFYAEQAMAKALKRVLKVCPKSREQARAVTLDDEADANAAQVWEVNPTLMLSSEVALDPTTEKARKAMRDMGSKPGREPEPVGTSKPKAEDKPKAKEEPEPDPEPTDEDSPAGGLGWN